MNRPNVINNSEMSRQLENVPRNENNVQPGSTVPEKVVQQEKQIRTAVTAVPPAIPPPSNQVIVAKTVSTETEVISRGSKINNIANKKNKNKKSVKPVYAVRKNPVRRVRVNRVSSCKLCGEPDDDNMVQCDDCSFWYHFECVNCDSSIENVSWSCSECAKAKAVKTPSATMISKCVQYTQEADRNQLQRNPPPNDTVSRKSAGRSSRRSEKRRIELQLQKLEEEKQLQAKYLEQKYILLQELESDSSSVTTKLDSLAENVSKVE